MNDNEYSIDMSEFSDNSHITNEIDFNDKKVSLSYRCLLNEQI